MVTGDAKEGNWLPVTYSNLSGWVMGEFVSFGTPAPVAIPLVRAADASSSPPIPLNAPALAPALAASLPDPAVALPPPAGSGTPAQYATVIPPDGLNLRGGPATSYPVVLTVPGGIRVQVVGRPTDSGWYSVVYNDKLGWVDGKYLNLGPVSVAAAATPAPASASGAASASQFVWPTASRRISTLFSAAHPGIDIDEFPNGGNPVGALAPGTVTFAGGTICCSYGLYVIVKHADGTTTLYAHMASISVREGQEVKQGTEVGKSGNTGFSTGAHVHLEVRKDGVAVNPLSLLPGSYMIE